MPSPPPPGLSVVIPTWNGRRLLEEFLPSVIAAAARFGRDAAEPVEIVVVDDGSTDDTQEWMTVTLSSSPVPMRLVAEASNRGFAAACNAGAAAAAFSRMLLLNNDLAIEEAAIAPLVAQLDRGDANGRLFAVHCRMKDMATGEDAGTGKVGGFTRGFLRVHRSYAPAADARRPLPSIFPNGGAALFDRERFLELGGFDEIFAPFYFEDVELGYRAWKRGLTVGYEPRAVVRHRFSSTIGSFGRARIQAVSQRNRLLLHWIHLHDRRWLVQHGVWVLLLALWSVVSFRPAFVRGLAGALRRWRPAAARRRAARRAAVRSDREVVNLFEELCRRDDVRAYDDPRELIS
jgi:GT2 family glycosyltransferase